MRRPSAARKGRASNREKRKASQMTNLTRRNFVKGAAVAGSAATMLSMAACGGSGSDSSTTDGGEKKKVLRFGQSNAKLGLDMQKSTSSGSSSVSDCVFEAPLRWTEDNELVPCLLTEIPTFEATASPCTAPSRRASSATTAPR